MTKNQELEILRKAIAELGTASYLGPWLASVTCELERDLMSDFIPLLTLADARKAQDELLHSAQSAAATTRQKAEREADQIKGEAIKEAQRIRAGVRHDLQKALNSIL